MEASTFSHHESCPSCFSKDNLAVYSDNHGYCFGCNTYVNQVADMEGNIFKYEGGDAPTPTNFVVGGIAQPLENRRLTLETCKKYSYEINPLERAQVANYYRGNKLVGQKLRYKDKKFRTIGKDLPLYGSHLFSKGKSIIITEGEIDCLSVSQVFDNKYPVVSLPQGASSAKKALKANYEYLLNFETIVLVFDNDEAGQKAVEEALLVLPYDRTKVGSLGVYKDASDALVAGDLTAIKNAYYNATYKKPDGFISGIDTWEMVNNFEKFPSDNYPYPLVQEMLKGIRKGEIVTITAGSGIGKSTICRELAYKLATQDGRKIAYIALEESVQKSVLHMMGLHLNKPIHITGKEGISDEVYKEAWDTVLGSDRFFFYDHFGSLESENLLAKIKYAVKVLEVDYIVLDHISIVVSGIETGDERRIIDNTMTQLRSLVEETHVGCFVVCHLSNAEGDKSWEDGKQVSVGKLRGSGSLRQLSDCVLAAERNQQCEIGSNNLQLRVLKNRFTGKTGTADILYYNETTGRLVLPGEPTLNEVSNEHSNVFTDSDNETNAVITSDVVPVTQDNSSNSNSSIYSTVVFDIETDGLLSSVSKVHCAVAYCPIEDEFIKFTPDKIDQFIELLLNADTLIGHNIVKYDIPVLEKLYGVDLFSGKVIRDTLILSRLVYPNLKDRDEEKALAGEGKYFKILGKHSLEAWGIRLNKHKDSFGKTSDWSTYSEDMLEYCLQDVVVTCELLDHLLTSLGLPDSVINLEHDFTIEMWKQEARGVKFDVDKAEQFHSQLLEAKYEITESLRTSFTNWYTSKGEFTPKSDNKRYGYTKDSTVTKIELNEFNPASRDHIEYWFKRKYDWKPTEFTDTGKPKIDESVLETLDYPEAEDLRIFFMLNKIIGMVADGKNGWLKLVTEEGRIHGSVNPQGTNTFRCSHSNPNLAQVPAVNDKKPLGKPCRELFTADPGDKLVGVDASGLELRCLAHYVDDPQYTHEILYGDIHTRNMEAAGLTDRNDAKRFIYAFLYGAGDEKLGEIVNGTAEVGKAMRNKFLQRNPSLAWLKSGVEQEAGELGCLRAIDGRFLYPRSVHSSLNLLLQSAGAIVMKKALLLLRDKLHVKGLEDYVKFVLNIHDEIQMSVKDITHPYEGNGEVMLPDYVGQLAVECIKEAGDFYKFNCPLDGEYKVGNNWSETH